VRSAGTVGLDGRLGGMAAVIGLCLLAGCLGITSTGSAGLVVPTGPTLEVYGVADRCSGDDTCFDGVQALTEDILAHLGEPVASPPGLPSVDGQPAVPLTVDVERDPPFDWRAADDEPGTSPRVRFDLSDHFLTDGDVVVNVGTDDDPRWYAVPDELGAELARLIFARTD
jgi:hypothetical protein